jgi:hypothetical protein
MCGSSTLTPGRGGRSPGRRPEGRSTRTRRRRVRDCCNGSTRPGIRARPARQAPPSAHARAPRPATHARPRCTHRSQAADLALTSRTGCAYARCSRSRPRCRRAPTYSSMILGGVPAAATRVGAWISLGIRVSSCWGGSGRGLLWRTLKEVAGALVKPRLLTQLIRQVSVHPSTVAQLSTLSLEAC